VDLVLPKAAHNMAGRILLTGDVMLGRLMNEVLQREPPAHPWGDTLPLFQSADFRICNLECVLADHGSPWSTPPKVFHFRSDAKNVKTLKAAAIDAVVLANNHVLDYEYAALFEMLHVLDRHHIGHAGAGASFAEASRPWMTVCQETRIGLIAFSDNEPPWEATAEKPGIFYVPVDLEDARAQRLLGLVRETKQRVDLLIVSAHWGPNWGYRPQAAHVPFAHALVEAGADVIFGHSCHVCQGIELYRGRPILYSTGNFIDDYAVDEIERNDRSFVFCLEIEKKAIGALRLYPTVIRRFRARRAEHPESDVMALKMQELCAELKTTTIWQPDEKCLCIDIPTVSL
jgi:poly-gamma-glutamate synthesis protein (capsule biosynthesis protein)